MGGSQGMCRWGRSASRLGAAERALNSDGDVAGIFKGLALPHTPCGWIIHGGIGPEANDSQVLAGLICRAWDFKFWSSWIHWRCWKYELNGLMQRICPERAPLSSFPNYIWPIPEPSLKHLDAPVTSTSQDYSPPYTQPWDKWHCTPPHCNLTTPQELDSGVLLPVVMFFYSAICTQ